MRVLQPLPDAPAWFGCFDVVQLNEDEMRQLSPDPLTLAAQALGAGVSLLVVTLGPKGAAYVAAPGFDGLADGRAGGPADGTAGSGRPRACPLAAVPPSSPRPRSKPSTPPAAAMSSAPRPSPGCSPGDPVEAALAPRHRDGGAQRRRSAAPAACAATSAASWWCRDPGHRGPRPLRRPLASSSSPPDSATGRPRRSSCSTRAARSGPRPTG